MEWIKCSERMPEVGQFTLIAWPFCKVPLIGCYKGLDQKNGERKWLGSDNDFWIVSEGEITHWCPLPNPPQQ